MCIRDSTNTFQAVFRVRSLAAMAIHQFFQDRDFVYVHTPLITGSDCEGAGEMFQVTTLDLNNVPKTEDGQVDIYGKVELTELAMALLETGCRLLSSSERDESLESYYINLVGGEEHA